MSEPMRALLDQVNTPEDLRTLLELPGMDDARLDQIVTAVGPTALLDHLFTLMATRFLPDRFRGRGGSVQWIIRTGPEDHCYHLAIADGKASAGRGATPGVRKPRATLRMSAPTLLHLCAGRLNGIEGFLQRKVRIHGDLLFAARMQNWFDY